MIYLIYGHQLPIMKKTLKTLINTCLNGAEQDDFNVERFSARLVLIQDIVFSCSSIPFFGDHKVVVVTDPYFLTNDKEKISLEKDQDYEKLYTYLANPNPHTDLIFFLESRDINQKSKAFELIKQHGKIMEQSPFNEAMLMKTGEDYFKRSKINISQEAIQELVNRCGDDISKFLNEAEKLSLFSQNIEVDDVKKLVCLKLEDNAFAIVDYLINNNIRDALKLYYDLRINKEEPVRLISLIASQFRFLMQVQFLKEKGKNVDEICAELKAKSFRVKKNIQYLIKINKYQIINILNQLYYLDYGIKSGKLDPYYNFELFIINFNNLKK